MNQTDFPSMKALVTGGTRGIGRAVALRLEALGATVAVTGLNSGVSMDAGDEVAVRNNIGALLDIHGHFDILVNNAGTFGPMKSALDYTLAEWEHVLRANLTSQFLVCREVVPLMVKRGYGRVVNLASVVGRDANPMAPAYSAAKAGVIRFTQALGRELANTGVLVNCVAPSAIEGTSLFDGAPPAQIEAMRAKVPMGRLGTVAEVAALVCWLASEECSYCTGAVFDCSGGRHG